MRLLFSFPGWRCDGRSFVGDVTTFGDFDVILPWLPASAFASGEGMLTVVSKVRLRKGTGGLTGDGEENVAEIKGDFCPIFGDDDDEDDDVVEDDPFGGRGGEFFK